MAKRRLPRGVKIEYAKRAEETGVSKKPVKELMHLWISKEKRRTHKRERREGRASTREQE